MPHKLHHIRLQDTLYQTERRSKHRSAQLTGQVYPDIAWVKLVHFLRDALDDKGLTSSTANLEGYLYYHLWARFQ